MKQDENPIMSWSTYIYIYMKPTFTYIYIIVKPTLAFCSLVADTSGCGGGGLVQAQVVVVVIVGYIHKWLWW